MRRSCVVLLLVGLSSLLPPPRLAAQTLADVPPDRGNRSIPAATSEPSNKAPADRFIEILRRPVRELQITSLSTAAVPQRLESEAPSVSRPGFTAPPPRWITSDGDRSAETFSEATRYTRRRLYFEDDALERHGVSGGQLPTGVWTNARSAIKFITETVIWPCELIKNRPDEPVSATAR
jgi:hypothetical protein